jgi:murein DD-endopeptidase MepM/ murein hydrolase activator NlpD
VTFEAIGFRAPVQGRVSSRFGWRALSVNGNHFHAGVDLAVPLGTPVHAARDGVVVKAGWGGTYGNVVYLDHGDGTQTRYAHLSRIDVQVGERLRQGDVLGLAGSTGASTGPHVHFELRFDGRAVDPLEYLPGTASR